MFLSKESWSAIVVWSSWEKPGILAGIKEASSLVWLVLGVPGHAESKEILFLCSRSFQPSRKDKHTETPCYAWNLVECQEQNRIKVQFYLAGPGCHNWKSTKMQTEQSQIIRCPQNISNWLDMGYFSSFLCFSVLCKISKISMFRFFCPRYKSKWASEEENVYFFRG